MVAMRAMDMAVVVMIMLAIWAVNVFLGHI